MAAATSPPASTGAVTLHVAASPMKVKTPPKFVKQARYLADVNDVLADVEHYAALEDNRGFIDAVQKAFRAIQRELSGVGECVNRHASTIEAHHTSFHNAHGTFKDIYKRSQNLEVEMKYDLAKL